MYCRHYQSLAVFHIGVCSTSRKTCMFAEWRVMHCSHVTIVTANNALERQSGPTICRMSVRIIKCLQVSASAQLTQSRTFYFLWTARLRMKSYRTHKTSVGCYKTRTESAFTVSDLPYFNNFPKLRKFKLSLGHKLLKQCGI